MSKLLWKTSLPCLALLLQPIMAQAGVAGRIQFATGEVEIQAANGQRRAAQKGAEVMEQESVITANHASAQIKMVDGGILALRADTHITLDAYALDANGQAEKAWISLFKGDLRSLTGQIGQRRQENYAIRTPNALISMRGSEHTAVAISPDAVLGQAPASNSYELANQGVAKLSNAAGTTFISRHQIGFTNAPNSAPNSAPQMLLNMPDFLPALPSLSKPSGPAGAPASTEATANPATGAVNTANTNTSNTDNTSNTNKLINQARALKALQANYVTPAKTGSNARGDVLDVNHLKITSNDGNVLFVAPNLSTLLPITNSPKADLVLAYIEQPGQSASEFGHFQNMLASAQQAQQTYQTQWQNAQSLLQLGSSVISFGKSSTQQVLDSNQALQAAGINPQHPLLQANLAAQRALQIVFEQSELSLDGRPQALSAAREVLGLAEKGQKVLQDYANIMSAYNKTPGQLARENLQYSGPAIQTLAAQAEQLLARGGLAEAEKSLQKALAQHAIVLEQAQRAQQELAKISPQDKHYALFQQASKDALRAAEIASDAVRFGQQALAASATILQNLQSLATLPVFDTRPLQDIAMDLSNGNYGLQITLSQDQQGKLMELEGSGRNSNGEVVRKMFIEANNSLDGLSTGPTVLSENGKDPSSGLAWGRISNGTVVSAVQYLGRDGIGQVGHGAIDKNTGNFILGHVELRRNPMGLSSLHYVTGLEAGPKRLAQSITGSATYNMLGATNPSDAKGSLGSLQKALLHANFSAQTVQALVNFKFGQDIWEIGADNIPLLGSQFVARACATCLSPGSVGGISVLSKNGQDMHPLRAAGNGNNAANHSASLSGSLMGAGLHGAGLQYSLVTGQDREVREHYTDTTLTLRSDQVIQGVVAFSGPKQAQNTAYRAITADDGSIAWANAAEQPLSPTVSASIHYGSPVSRLEMHGGELESFVGSALGASNHFTPGQAGVPSAQDLAATIQRGSARNTDQGQARLGNISVNWGRWENGVVNIYSRDGQTQLGSINNAARSIHWLSTSATNGPLASLPQTGSATYSVVGHTQPSDLKGNVGVLGQAKVEIDFTAMRANTNLQLSFNAPDHVAQWQMDVKSTPIIRTDNGFNSSSQNHGVNGESHVVHCQGSGCGNSHVGNLSAFFLGQGAVGLGMSYDMLTGERNAKNQFIPRNNAHGLVILQK